MVMIISYMNLYMDFYFVDSFLPSLLFISFYTSLLFFTSRPFFSSLLFFGSLRFFSGQSYCRSLWRLLRIAIFVLICWWGMTTRPQFHVHIWLFIYCQLFSIYYPFGRSRESIEAKQIIQTLALRVSLWLTSILTRQPFWSPD